MVLVLPKIAEGKYAGEGTNMPQHRLINSRSCRSSVAARSLSAKKTITYTGR